MLDLRSSSSSQPYISELVVVAEVMLAVEDKTLVPDDAIPVSIVNDPLQYLSSTSVLVPVVLVPILERDSCAMGIADIHKPLSSSK